MHLAREKETEKSDGVTRTARGPSALSRWQHFHNSLLAAGAKQRSGAPPRFSALAMHSQTRFCLCDIFCSALRPFGHLLPICASAGRGYCARQRWDPCRALEGADVAAAGTAAVVPLGHRRRPPACRNERTGVLSLSLSRSLSLSHTHTHTHTGQRWRTAAAAPVYTNGVWPQDV